MEAHPGPGRAPLIVWAGGAAFVGSLAYAAVTFVSGMRRDPTASLPAGLAADLVLFSAFAAHHSVMARAGVKRRLSRYVAPRFERAFYVWVASLLLAGVMWGWQDLPGRAYRHAGLAALPHWLLVGAGVWLTAQATRAIDPLHLAGIRQAAGDPSPDAFKVTGPYHVIRHPIYVGWMLMVFGVPDMTWTRCAFAAISSAYLVAAIPFEERSLSVVFGETYRRYRERVRWRLVPGVW
jgi:methanethiol S-methyltransferase